MAAREPHYDTSSGEVNSPCGLWQNAWRAYARPAVRIPDICAYFTLHDLGMNASPNRSTAYLSVMPEM